MKDKWVKIAKNSKLECFEEKERIIIRWLIDGDCIPIPKKELRTLIQALSKYVPPIKISSRKAKARILQEWCCERISKLTGIPWGKDELIQSRPMGQSGPDVVLLPGALDWFPWTVECKSAEQWNIPAAIQQAIANLYDGTSWLLILKSKKIAHPIVVLDGIRFFELLKSKNKEIVIGLLNIAMASNISIHQLCSIAKINIPKLTNDECKAISRNYPYSFNDIKFYFGKS